MKTAEVKQERPVRGELLTIAEVKTRYRLKKDALYRLIKAGKLASFDVPFSWTLVDSADIDDLLRQYKNPAYALGNK